MKRYSHIQQSMNSFIILILLFVGIAACNKDDMMMPPTIHYIDSLTMVEFYHSMDGEHWPEDWRWDLKDPTSWRGVDFIEIDGLKRVSGILLTFDMESGYCVVPESIGNLEYMDHFISRNLSRVGGKIPESLFNCPLQYLEFGNAKFLVGPLSPSISKLKNTLIWLTIVDCPNFGGELPIELGECQNTNIQICSCDIRGHYPIEFKRIKYINLNKNHLTSLDWRYLTDKDVIFPWLNRNDFFGEMPDEILTNDRLRNTAECMLAPFNKGFGYSNVSWNNLKGDKDDTYW